jgi:hypothetical protein
MVARCPSASVALPHHRLRRLGVNHPSPCNPFLPRSHTCFSTISIYDIVVFSSCRRISSSLLAVTSVTVVASVVVKHGSILTAGIACTYAAQLVYKNRVPVLIL